MFDPLRQRAHRDALGVVNFFRRVEEHGVGRRLHLDDMRPHQRGHVCGIGADIHGGFAFLGDHAAARIGPDDHGETHRFCFLRQFADLFHQLELVLEPG